MVGHEAAAEALERLVDRRGHAVQPAEQDDLAVEVVGLDRRGGPGEALPRRPAVAPDAVDRGHLHVLAPFGVVVGGRVDAGRLVAGQRLGPRPLVDVAHRAVAHAAGRLQHVGQVEQELAVLAQHHLRVGARQEAGRREVGAEGRVDVVHAGREATDVEDARGRRAVGVDHPGFHVRGREHHGHAVHVGEPPQGPPLVVDAVLRAHHGHVGRRRCRDRVEGRLRVLGLRAHDHHVAGAEPEGRHVVGDRHLHLHRPRRRAEQEAAVPQRVVVRRRGPPARRRGRARPDGRRWSRRSLRPRRSRTAS